MQTIQKLTLLRAAMRKKGLAAYIIPSSDPHQSEYVADYWNARTWLSGFDGSAGTLVVTMDWAGLWTDSRYFIQAAHQLAGSGIELMEKVSGGGLEYDEYLAEQLAPESLIGLDGRLFSIFQLQFIEETFEYADLELAIDCDLVDDIWQNRPPISTQSIFSHELKYAGQSRAEKLAMVREEMEAQAADIYLVSALDEIAWLFNLRGSDTAYNPVFYAYAAITATYVYLFTDQNKIDQLLKQQLQADAVSFANYHDFATFITQIERDQVVLYDDKSLSAAHYSAMGSDYHIRLNPIKKLKAVKNEVELRHLRKTMEKDGVALLKTYRWLAAALSDGNVSEYELGKRIAQFRSEQDLYQGESFHPIVGYEANGAIVHYRAKAGDCADIQAKGVLLVDSGGQYLDGTTDITRTITLGIPTAEQKRNFTLVLKGHIALASICFPTGTTGHQLDVLARQALWKHHLDYGHGTGHGVGFFLNVHESPPGVSPSSSSSGERSEFKVGMVFSNEPGYYKAGEYGIRTENLMCCVADQTSDVHGEFLKFETLTLFPIDTKLIDFDLLNGEELDWLNNYHQEVYERLSFHLNAAERQWLAEQCKSV